jgi:acetoacetyl-CoA synthetase
MNTPLWAPSEQQIEQTNLYNFMKFVAKDGHKIDHYQDLYDFSVRLPQLFWKYLWDYGSFIQASEHTSVLQTNGDILGSKWFEGATFNFAQNLLKFRDDRPAITAYDERGKQQAISYAQLYKRVMHLSNWFKQQGIQPGDRIVAFMPNVPEAIIAMLAAVSIGAVWSSCSPDFGLQGVVDRFGQIKPKIIITTDGYFYSGKTLNSLEKLNLILEDLSSIEHVVVVPYVNKDLTQPSAKDQLINRTSNTDPSQAITLWQDAMNIGEGIAVQKSERTQQSIHSMEIEFEALPFDHPLYILYSSGTTGAPKCIVHSAGGTLIQHYKELVLHTDVKSDDTLFYYTTCGWMMWNWMTSTLMTGASLVIFDGSPFYPETQTLWNMIEEQKVSIFGTSAKYISTLHKLDYIPNQHHDLSHIKTLLSTGSPLSSESYDFAYRSIKQDMCLSSIAGGTDIISCFVLGNPTLPVYKGEIQCLGLGMAVNVYDDKGQALDDNQQGELVCEKPFPAMPIGFYNDNNDEKYLSSYFKKFNNVWAHGDIVEKIPREFNQHKYTSLVIHGRSDAVLNPGGVRIGTAEIYRQVEKVDAVIESIAVGQTWPKDSDDVRVVLFVVLKPNQVLNDALIKEIKTTIRSNTTPRHVPSVILQVPDIPKTLSGKIVEVAVRDTINGKPVKNKDALLNPDSLSLYENLAALNR